MPYFEYCKDDKDAELYDLLHSLMDYWESETVEFKEARGQYDADRIGKYFSALSNEANLKHEQCGWLIFGISEGKNKQIVGTHFKEGKEETSQLLENFKFEISKNITDGMSFTDIIELHPVVDGAVKRVLMFKIPAAVTGIPTEWKNVCYARSGNSTVLLSQYKIDQIRSEDRADWSGQILPFAKIENLSSEAIAIAREKYKEKVQRPHIAEEIDSISDIEFLGKMKLSRNGKITNAAMLLLGNSDYDNLFVSAPQIMWRLYDRDFALLDYEIFSIPYITVSDLLLKKVRNLKYRYMPNQQSLFPTETEQYDSWLLRELINNSLAHSNYQLGGRIYLNEFEDKISISNPGNFLPVSIENVLSPAYNPPFYRNRLLVEAMVKFNMIDTATSGIKKIFRIQKAKYFPMPDYDLSTTDKVEVTVYGKVLDDRYTRFLFAHPGLDINTVYLLDQIQKGRTGKVDKETIKLLRKNRLIEGRGKNLYVSSEILQTEADKVQYIKNRAFDNQYYQDMIVTYLKKFKKAKRRDIKALLWDKLPEVLTERQKDRKILTLLAALKNAGIIETDCCNKQLSNWVLKR